MRTAPSGVAVPWRVMALTVPPGALVANSGEVPPRTTSRRSVIMSSENSVSTLKKLSCGSSNRVMPSSWYCT